MNTVTHKGSVREQGQGNKGRNQCFSSIFCFTNFTLELHKIITYVLHHKRKTKTIYTNYMQT